MSHTLVLNRDYTPLNVAPLSTIAWREAIKLIYLDQVDVLEYYDDWYVHSPSVTMQVPSVMVSRTYVKTSRGVKFTKNNLCIRDNHQCQYCQRHFDARALTIDHVTPRSRGGKTTWTNVCCACSSCNTAKADKLLMRPMREPLRPTHGEILTKVKRTPVMIPDHKWIPYIGWPPQLVTVKNHPHMVASSHQSQP